MRKIHAHLNTSGIHELVYVLSNRNACYKCIYAYIHSLCKVPTPTSLRKTTLTTATANADQATCLYISQP